MNTYFAVDGNYGDAAGLTIVSTDKWTEEDWVSIEEEPDYYRPELALEIARKYND